MTDIYINNIGIIFINQNKQYSKIYFNSKDEFNRKKINSFKKEKEELINENIIIKKEFEFCMKMWTINNSSSTKILNKFLKDKNQIENIIIKNKKRINYLDKLIQNILINTR
tara:strand:- start:361 stop:696 length:336 start_codon:yes stop_codon:yes gene_type:complete